MNCIELIDTTKVEIYNTPIHSDNSFGGIIESEASRGFALTPSRVLSVVGLPYFCRETRYCARSIEATGKGRGGGERREKVEARPSRISSERARPHAMLTMNEIKNLGKCNVRPCNASSALVCVRGNEMQLCYVTC